MRTATRYFGFMARDMARDKETKEQINSLYFKDLLNRNTQPGFRQDIG